MAGSYTDDDDAMSSINVTPLVDVVLVLLIVFMITVPAMVASAPVKVDVPESKSIKAEMAESESLPLTLFLRSEEGQTKVYIGEQVMTLEGLTAFLKTLQNVDKSAEVKVSADQSLPYGDILAAMDSLGAIGLHKISLDTKHVQ